MRPPAIKPATVLALIVASFALPAGCALVHAPKVAEVRRLRRHAPPAQAQGREVRVQGKVVAAPQAGEPPVAGCLASKRSLVVTRTTTTAKGSSSKTVHLCPRVAAVPFVVETDAGGRYDIVAPERHALALTEHVRRMPRDAAREAPCSSLTANDRPEVEVACLEPGDDVLIYGCVEPGSTQVAPCDDGLDLVASPPNDARLAAVRSDLAWGALLSSIWLCIGLFTASLGAGERLFDTSRRGSS